jgi:peptidyl-prolyl cis-trans isomerase C
MEFDEDRMDVPGKGTRHGAPEHPPAQSAVGSRAGLVVSAVLFIALFAVLGISEGIGDPSVPDGAIATVEDAPAGLGVVSKAEFDRSFDQIVAAQGGEAAPNPGDPRYEQFALSALFTILDSIWLQGVAEERGIDPTDEEIAREVRKLRAESFPSAREYEAFLEESKFTPADFEERVLLQIITDTIEQEFADEAPEPTQGEIETYYESAKARQFNQVETRDFRYIVNKDAAKIKRALRVLRADKGGEEWVRLARTLSENPSGAQTGGLLQGIPKGLFPQKLDDAVFSASLGKVEGPIKTRQGYNIFEVTKIDPEEAQPLKEVESQIVRRLSRRAEGDAFTAFVADFNSRWRDRTFCAADYAIERCANFEGDGRPEGAPPACYEADPRGGRPPACPAIVSQLVPAMPGSVTPLRPQGNPVTQRPRPGGE